jgi:N-acetylneuraminic acid mutarotase
VIFARIAQENTHRSQHVAMNGISCGMLRVSIPLCLLLCACADSNSAASARPDAFIDGTADVAPDVVFEERVDAREDVRAAPGWRVEAPLPVDRQEHAVIAARGRLWVIGGFERGSVVADVRVFNPTTQSWTEGPPLPGPRHHVAAVAVGDDLYALGGLTGVTFTPDAMCFVLRSGAARWEVIPSLPAPRGAATAGVIDGRIVVVGGFGPGRTLFPQTLVYDPEMARWREGAAMPTVREHLASFVHERRLYVVAGRRLSLASNLDVMESYDPASDTWRTEPAVPTPRGGHGVAVLDGCAYVIGGETTERALDTVEAFELATRTWRQAPSIPTPRHGFGVAVLAGRLWVVGGGNVPAFGAVPVVESYAP